MDAETIPAVETDNRKPYKVKDVTRNIKKAVVAATLEEVKAKAAEKFGQPADTLPTIHLDSDGTEIDDEEYFQTLEPNAELIAVFSGEQWMDPTHYVTITTRRDSADSTDCADVERVHLKKLVGQLRNNLCSVSVLSEPDLELLSNMDPNSLADITGKDFIEQLKEASGRLGGGTGWSGYPPHLDSLNVLLFSLIYLLHLPQYLAKRNSSQLIFTKCTSMRLFLELKIYPIFSFYFVDLRFFNKHKA
ncbi:DNA fragmentation factor subunit alpha isoform X1 [Lutzomyia longipalpis]|uniref:DNA fragmentation factor subunit alpha isoform X1 n=1 Tax=Lutzomyia longipalpis TaxID=7200 RepID=UPI002483AD66|nr:DNA fragmentation factor subunit alpha isoform X1 [Lutzomyia longipalpis]